MGENEQVQPLLDKDEESLELGLDKTDEKPVKVVGAYSPLPESDSQLRKRIINLATPALIEMSLMTLVGMVDMMMVGRLGPWAIAAVGLSNQPMFVGMSVFMSLNVGATALVARFIGAGKPEDASKVARQALVLASIMGLVLTMAGLAWAENILVWMGAEEDVIRAGSSYLRVVFAGLVFQGAGISLTAALRGAGDTKTPMSTNIVANLVNIVGNWLLINGHLGFPRLEVTGAAVATFLARLVACVLILRKVMSGSTVIKISLKDSFKPDFSIIRRIFRVGLPAALEQLVMRSGQMVFVRIVSSFGTVVYAAHQVALNIESLTFMPGTGFQTASTALVGQSLGAKDPEKAERFGWQGVRVGLYLALLMSCVFFFLGKYLAMLYTDDQTVISLSSGALKIMAFAQPCLVTNFILVGALRERGYPLGFVHYYGWHLGVRVVVAYIFAVIFDMGLYGAWIGMALDVTTRSLLALFRFRTGHWKKIKV